MTALLTFFAVGTIAFWGFEVLLFLFIVGCLETESYKSASLFSLILISMALFLPHGLWPLIIHNIGHSIITGAGYLVLGTIWSIIKWYLKCPVLQTKQTQPLPK